MLQRAGDAVENVDEIPGVPSGAADEQATSSLQFCRLTLPP